MSEPRTLHEGGTGLGCDVSEAETKQYCTYCIVAYSKNRALNKALVSRDQEIAALHTKTQWLTLMVAAAFAAGFLLCSVLGAVAVWR